MKKPEARLEPAIDSERLLAPTTARMNPMMLKTCGYLVSTMSVALLGYAAWPGAEEAGLVSVLVLGMFASTAGMALRWASHAIESRRVKREARDLSRQMRFDGEQGAPPQAQQQDGLTYLSRRK